MKIIAATLLIVFALVLAVWQPWAEKARFVPEKTRSEPPFSSPPEDRVPDPLPSSTGPRPAAETPPASELLLSTEDRQKVQAAIDNLGFTLRDYGTALKGNPVGTNAEITAALLGDNAKQVKLEIPAGSTLNDKGELCDPWGTPWFFHQLSAYKTEIHSAGPDRKMYTEDDFVR
ncbi:hypothetical protein [Haloferula sp. BvORR071]|uniref:hypothetical protein n=1 Tax=Haloferula sp. BvORR071 TaxID=1396141 RepID=UPI002240EEEB|nr:hypothetical protein [Haloferula sp. BvORR071]